MSSWLRQACEDSDRQVDMAYLVIGVLAASAIGTIVFIFAMSAIDYSHCQPQIVISNGDTSTRMITPCKFDPLPLGQAVGLIFGAFATLITGLAAYMAATRRQPRPQPSTTTATASVTTKD